jgi:hypothetical protein
MDASGLYEMARGFHDGQATLLDEFPTQDGSQVLYYFYINNNILLAKMHNCF